MGLIFSELLNSVLFFGNPHPPINPSPSQTASDAFGPSPFDIFEPY
jgi:hypothetical protein